MWTETFNTQVGLVMTGSVSEAKLEEIQEQTFRATTQAGAAREERDKDPWDTVSGPSLAVKGP